MPEGYQEPAGTFLKRNPGVTCLWTCTTWEWFDAGGGRRLITLGEPTAVAWYAQKQPASRVDILASIDSGMPLLQQIADEEGGDAPAALRAYYERMLRYLPAA